MKLIELIKDKHYIVVDDLEIKDEELYLSSDKKVLRFTGRKILGDILPKECKRITHSTQPIGCNCAVNNRSLDLNCTERNHCFDNVKYIPLSEIEEVVYGYNVEKMALKKYGDDNYPRIIENRKGFKDGFNAHKELTKDKLFTVEDIRKAFYADHSIFSNRTKDYHHTSFEDWFRHNFKPKTEWAVEFDEQGKLKLI